MFNRREVLWHGAFWLLYLFIRVFLVQLYPGPFLYRLGLELIELPLKMAALYFAIYVLIKGYLFRRQYKVFAAVFVLYFFSVLLLRRAEDYYVTYLLIAPSIRENAGSGYYNIDSKFLQKSITRHEDGFWDLEAGFLNLIYIYPVVGLGAAVYFARSWYEDHLAKERIQKEGLQAELKNLKEQLHPHFLFNTLNNIYSLAQAGSDKTPGMIHKLSELLGFMLYEGSAPAVPVRHELRLLNDYIDLERIRLGDRLQVTFEQHGDLDDKFMAPLLLFPFVENCFKHGPHKTMNQVWIRIDVRVDDETLTAEIENTLHEPAADPGASRGVGLANIQRRLDLLYPGRHQLTIRRDSSFLVRLKIMLP